jgi:hypothetical protein
MRFRKIVFTRCHRCLHHPRKGTGPWGRGRGSNNSKSSLPSRITTERVTSVVVACSRDHTHQRAQGTKAMAVTSTRNANPHPSPLSAEPQFPVLWAAKQRTRSLGSTRVRSRSRSLLDPD